MGYYGIEKIKNGDYIIVSDYPSRNRRNSIMKVDIVVPEEYLGNVMGDITSRRGRPMGQEAQGNSLKINAYVPLSEMFGYATSLRSNTQGRGTFMMLFDHYEEVPKSISEDIIKKNGAQ